MRISRKAAALSATLVAVVAVVLIDAREDKPAVRAAPGAAAATATASKATTEPKAAPQPKGTPEPQPEQPAYKLPERSGLNEPTSPLFSSRSWEPPPPKVVAPPRAVPPAPTAPPMPFRFVGRMLQDGQLFVFLAKGDTVMTVKQGDTIDGVYRVESVGETEVALTYLPLRQKQTIAVVSSLPGALAIPGPPAGPQRPPAALSSGPAVAPPAPAPAPEQARTGATFGVPIESVVTP
jgi:hypothetical protein